MDASLSPHSAPSFSDACSYLDKFCVRHKIIDQSHAALAAVLLFPSMGGCQTLQLKCKGGDGPKESEAGEKITLNINSSINYERRNAGILLAFACLETVVAFGIVMSSAGFWLVNFLHLQS